LNGIVWDYSLVEEEYNMNVWILKEVESKEILGAYDKKEQAMLHAESFVGGEESEQLMHVNDELTIVGYDKDKNRGIATVERLTIETNNVWD